MGKYGIFSQVGCGYAALDRRDFGIKLRQMDELMELAGTHLDWAGKPAVRLSLN